MADDKNGKYAGGRCPGPTEFLHNRQKKDGVGIPDAEGNAQGDEADGDDNPSVKNDRTPV